ncbi:MAG: VWA domain-containing protein, partial [Anaerolineae bacterium]
IDAALGAAGDELATSPTRSRRNRGVIILLSDGAHNGPAAEVLAAAAAVAPLTSAIYAIGLGSDVDADLLRAVAGPGRYYFAPNEEALADVYDAIAVRIPCR